MAFELGHTYGDYQFIDVVESSRSGVVYRVRNLAENRFELLRVLPKALQEDPERVERFLREAKVRARLNHSNIVTFYYATVLEGQFVMTTEVVEGRTLADRLELGPLAIEAAVESAIQVLSALSYAHQHGVIHRDVSSENLMITPDGVIKLTGFSFARAVNDPKLTQMGAALGQVHYMSPEQVRGVEEPDARSDVYSMGIVLYEMLTGRRPFESNSQFDIMLAHVNTPPVPPTQLNSMVPLELDRVVLKALAKDAARRFQNAIEFREALQAPSMLEPEGEAVEEPPPAPALVAVSGPRPEVEPNRHIPSHWPVPDYTAAPVPVARGDASATVAGPPDIPEMRFGAREIAVLAFGVMLMVMMVFAVAR
jgi:serine/threonine-protein kinase